MTLNVWLKAGYTVEVIDRLVDEARQELGLDLRVEVVDEATAHDGLVERARTGEGPDIATVSFWYLPEYAAEGWVTPVNEVAPDVELDRYHPRALEAMSRDGELLAVPHTLIGGMLASRRDLLEAAGLEVPRGPAEICEAAAALAGPSTAGLVARGAPDFPSYGTFNGWAWAKGVSLLDAPAEQAADAIADLVTALREHGARDAASMGYEQAGDAVRSGDAAMIFDTSGWGNYFEDPERSSVDGRIAYSVPRGERGAVQFPYSEGLAVMSWSRQKPAAARFLAWRHDERTLLRECLEQHRFDFPRTDLRDWDAVSGHAEELGLGGYLEALAASWDALALESFPLRTDFTEVGRALMQPISEAIAGGGVDELAGGIARARRQVGLSA